MACALLNHFVTNDLAPHAAFTIIICPIFVGKVITGRTREGSDGSLKLGAWKACTWRANAPGEHTRGYR